MSERRPLVIGEAPSAASHHLTALHPASQSGERLMRMMGLTPEQYLAGVQRMNLFPQPLGTWDSSRRGKDRWSERDARMVALSMRPLLHGRTVICAGRRVATAFGFCNVSTPFFEWVEVPFCQGAFRACVIPHPSGRNHYWNDRSSRRLAEGFLQKFAKEVVLGGCLLSRAVIE